MFKVLVMISAILALSTSCSSNQTKEESAKQLEQLQKLRKKDRF